MGVGANLDADTAQMAPAPLFSLCASLFAAHINDAASALGVITLKPEQEEAITSFVQGKDVFVALPTGYGKSLCYFALPLVFDRVRAVDRQSIVLVVSPLVALMEDQVAHCSSRELTADFIGYDSSDSMKKRILEGKCQVFSLALSHSSVEGDGETC